MNSGDNNDNDGDGDGDDRRTVVSRDDLAVVQERKEKREGDDANNNNLVQPQQQQQQEEEVAAAAPSMEGMAAVDDEKRPTADYFDLLPPMLPDDDDDDWYEEEGWYELLEKLHRNDPSVTVVDRDSIDDEDGDESKAMELAHALSGNSSVRQLLLNTLDMNAAGARALAAVVRNMPSLQSLLVSWCEEVPEQEVCRILLDAAGDCESLTDLEIGFSTLGYVGERQDETALSRVLRKTRSIRSLTLIECGFSSDHSRRPVAPSELGLQNNDTIESVSIFGEDKDRPLAHGLLPSLFGKRSLKNLVLRDCWSAHLFRVLKSCPSLESLSLLWCGLRDVDGGLHLVVRGIMHSRSIQSFRLHEWQFTTNDCVLLRSLFRRRDYDGCCPALSEVILSSETGLGVSNFNMLLDGLLWNESIQSLELPHTRLQRLNDVALVRDILIMNKRITKLNLEQNSIGPTGGHVLAQAVRTSRCNLTSLNVSGCNLGDRGVHSLCESLRANGSLQTLRIDSNYVTHTGLCSVVWLLEANRFLREVRMDGNPITRGNYHRRASTAQDAMPAGATLASLLQRNTPLLQLSAQDCGLSSADVSCIFSSLQENTVLDEIHLADNLDLDEASLLQLATSLPCIRGLKGFSFTWPSPSTSTSTSPSASSTSSSTSNTITTAASSSSTATTGGVTSTKVVSLCVLNFLMSGFRQNHSLELVDAKSFDFDDHDLRLWAAGLDFCLARNKQNRLIRCLSPTNTTTATAQGRREPAAAAAAAHNTTLDHTKSFNCLDKLFPYVLERMAHTPTGYNVQDSLIFHFLREKLLFLAPERTAPVMKRKRVAAP